MTDAGRGFLKALGNKEGPHVLGAEWVGTALADWIGLRTLAVAKLVVATDDEIPLGHGRAAEPGTAIAIRAEAGGSWAGTVKELQATENASDVARLVVFDTWVRNCDRYPADLASRKPNPDNVFLSSRGAKAGHFILKAFDHTHCFDCGRELAAPLSQIDRVKDERIYGRFPAFGEFMDRSVAEDAVARLGRLDRAFVEQTVADIAGDWQVSASGRRALTSLICDRAEFVAGSLLQSLFP
jgi:hypothetical protein